MENKTEYFVWHQIYFGKIECAECSVVDVEATKAMFDNMDVNLEFQVHYTDGCMIRFLQRLYRLKQSV